MRSRTGIKGVVALARQGLARFAAVVFAGAAPAVDGAAFAKLAALARETGSATASAVGADVELGVNELSPDEYTN